MKIIVFVKQVPDTDDVKLDPKTGNLQREGVQSIMNPLDANAVETALWLKEKYGGSVVAVSMGPPQADDVLKKALAMGCDESALLSDRALGGADTLATGYPLAKAAEKLGDYDLLICGRHATDAETAQTAQADAQKALEAMDWAVNAQVLSGKGNGVLDPLGTATRAEVAQVLMNFGENVQ